MLEKFSLYVSGIVDMATSMSKKIGYSYICVNCFDINSYKEGISLYYEIPLKNIKFTKVHKTLYEVFSMYFEDELLNNLLWLIKKDTDDELKVYRILEDEILSKLSCFNGGKLPFYMIEDFYIVLFKKYAICFVIGNNL